MSRSRIFSFALALVPTLAFADDIGGAGTVEAVEVNTTSADAYLQYHGRIRVRAGGVFDEYRWGGTSCGTRVLTDAQVALLARALESGGRIVPRYQPGQGSARCLVGFITEAP